MPMIGTYYVYKPAYRPYLMSENSIIQGCGSARNGVANQVQLCPVYLQQAANVQAMTGYSDNWLSGYKLPARTL